MVDRFVYLSLRLTSVVATGMAGRREFDVARGLDDFATWMSTLELGE